MTDIFEAMGKRTSAPLPAVDVIALEDSRLFPPPSAEQQVEFTKIATRLLQAKPAAHGMILAFAGNVSGEGASYVSHSLACIFARGLGRRTLWIDANFLSPHPLLTDAETDTLADYLAQPARTRTREARGMLGIMPGGAGLRAFRAELTSDNCREVFATLRQQYDFVLIDCPPVLEAVETSWLGQATDGLVLVVEARRLKAEIVHHGLELLGQHNVNVVGTILNKRRYELPKAIYDRV